ncbi:IS5 family transposase [Streptomyces sp. MC1]|uniref:IS5 family transposase n=1 Tax=Streptomyces sp. MC1 TaxID=295105 RepID=UPI001E5A8CBE|nr:IS5 family transposase [Streptomyces sp. MC1]
MSDAEWTLVRDLLPAPGWPAGRGGPPEGYCHRQMIDAVRCLVDNGIKWRAVPSDFPPWPRVYAFFARWRDTGLVAELHERLREPVRTSEGRSPEPNAAVVDSQSMKADATVAHVSRGYDAGKKINGRKRHLLTDTLGLLLAALVTPASTTDRDAARILLPAAKKHFRRLVRVEVRGGGDPSAHDGGAVGAIVRGAQEQQASGAQPGRQAGPLQQVGVGLHDLPCGPVDMGGKFGCGGHMGEDSCPSQPDVGRAEVCESRALQELSGAP